MEMAKSIVWRDETLVIRKYDVKRDQEKVLELWQAAFGNQISSSLWQWKYIENPYSTTILICENAKGMPVVLYGGIPFTSICFGRTIRMIHLSDIMSHPDYRGSGLFIQTANAYFETFGNIDDICIMYGFPGKYHFDIGAKYLNYSQLGDGAAFFRGDCKNIKSLKHIISGSIHLAHAPSHSSDQTNYSSDKVIHHSEHTNYSSDKAAHCCDKTSHNYDQTSHDFDQIWRNASTDYPLSVIRNSAYVEWRYFNHPEKTYEVWCYKTRFNKDSKAFIVIQIKGRKAVIVDILVQNSEKIFRDFLGNIASMLLKRGIETVEVWVPHDHFLAVFFQGCGVKRTKEPIGIIPTVRLFDDMLDIKQVCQNFYYSMGDGDLL
ncbi:MAG: GNAT family N-acetyltransferase [Desulfamplus sp.]|nr:GNAT family N-acetyltransferase [Desulfamplus sp.]